jgi:hypothetical protein
MTDILLSLIVVVIFLATREITAILDSMDSKLYDIRDRFDFDDDPDPSDEEDVVEDEDCEVIPINKKYGT